jgi:hypothetical protein
LGKDEEEFMKAKMEEVKLRAANKLRRKSTIMMGTQSPKTSKKK